MSIGFVILSHRSQDWRLLAKLLPRLRELGEVDIALHHDTYQSAVDTALVKRYGVRLIPPVGRTYWSHISKVFAIVRGLECLFRLPRPPRWYATLSPSCYPIKSAGEIVAQLSKLTADFYVDMREVDLQSTGLELDRYVEEAVAKRTIGHVPFVSRRGRFYWRPIRVRRPRSVIPFGKHFRLFHGSDWFLLGPQAVAHILDADIPQHPVTRFYLEAYSQAGTQSPCPVETLFQSILGNANHLVGQHRNWHYIDWNGVTDWHPRILTEEHWEQLTTSDALWARKFHPERSEPLRRRLGAEVLNRG
ncbi:MAG: beta-1,6-N-acetylglucosaminyltransferase [Chloracidobacterium sp.]